MYVAAYGLNGTIADVRKAIHKFIPRELSPTRLIEKYAADSKKKGAAKLAKVSSDADARDAASQAAYDKQISALTALTPVDLTTSAPLPFAVAPRAAAKPSTNYAPWIAGGAFLLVVLAMKRNRS